MASFSSLVGGSVINARNSMNVGHVTQLIVTESEYDALWSGGSAGSGTFTGDDDTLYFITED